HGAAQAADAAPNALANGLEDHVVLGALQAAAAGDDDLRLGQLGKAVETSSRRSTSFILAAGILTLGFSTVALLPAWLSAGLKTLGRRVATHGAFAHVIFASSLPA